MRRSISPASDRQRVAFIVVGVVGAGCIAVGAYAAVIGTSSPSAPPVGGQELGTLIATVDGARLYEVPSKDVGPAGETDRVCYSLAVAGQPLMMGCGSKAVLDRSGSFFSAPPSGGVRKVWALLPVGAVEVRQGGTTQAVTGRLASLQFDVGSPSFSVKTATGTVTLDVN